MSARGRRWLAALLDSVTYALTAAGLATAASALVSYPLGAGLVGVKFGLFYLGFLVFAIAIVVSWPGSAWQDANLSVDLLSIWRDDDEETAVPWVDTEPSGTSGEPAESPFQAVVQALPPARFLPARPDERLPTGFRLFLAAIAIHATSFVLERYFGAVAV
jgi:hypothetical protein